MTIITTTLCMPNSVRIHSLIKPPLRIIPLVNIIIIILIIIVRIRIAKVRVNLFLFLLLSVILSNIRNHIRIIVMILLLKLLLPRPNFARTPKNNPTIIHRTSVTPAKNPRILSAQKLLLLL